MPGPARAHHLTPRRLVAAVAATVVAAATLALPATAQTGLPVAPVPTTEAPSVPVERTLQEKLIIDAAIRLSKSRADLLDVEKSLGDTADKLVAAEQALAETERKLLDARTQVVDLRTR